MVYSLTWLPAVLEQAGLKVAEQPGWRTRGRSEMGTVRGVICHHTAGAARGNMPSLGVLVHGRPDLPGPLAQLGLGRDGTFYVVAAGRANHAGRGFWGPITTGNSSFIGIEGENDGIGEPWPPVQMEAYQRGVAAILAHIGAGANMCCGHKEWAPHRKSDPSFPMLEFRAAVADRLSGRPPPAPIAARDDSGRPTRRRGNAGPEVAQIQALLQIAVDGRFGSGTEAAVRAFQRRETLVPDGIVGPRTWAALSAGPAAVPAAAIPPATTPAPQGVGDRSETEDRMPPADSDTAAPRMQGRRALGPDGTCFAYQRGSGLKADGQTAPEQWLASRKPLPISDSQARVLCAIGHNEGALEAVNTYDDAHLSFGMLQWTAGADPGAAELPALLSRLKRTDPTAFDDCFGRYGLDVDSEPANETTGIFVLDGEPLRTGAQKLGLSDLIWAYRFWRAGHHPSVRQSQIAHAVSRIAGFLAKDACGRPLGEWITSELGVAMLLDEHVNRPGHVPQTLVAALKAFGEANDPTHWTDGDEHDLISAYLDQRSRTSMTDSDGRAGRIIALAHEGKLSRKRGSYVAA